MIRTLLRKNDAWITLRQSHREGFGRAWRRWRLWRSVLRTKPIGTRTEGDTEVRLICYRYDYLCAIWSLKSFYREAGVSYRLSIQIQGVAPPRVKRTLLAHFPNARIVEQREADQIVESALIGNGWTRLLEGRRTNQYMQKLTDNVILSKARRVITLDGDLLFFRKPVELLEFDGAHIFQQDLNSTYLVKEACGVKPGARLNAGLMAFRPDTVSLARCNDYLADFPTYHGWLDQTLFALHAGETGTANVLPSTYLISLERNVDPKTLVVRHYAGPSRPLMTEEGMPYLIRNGFLDR